MTHFLKIYKSITILITSQCCIDILMLVMLIDTINYVFKYEYRSAKKYNSMQFLLIHSKHHALALHTYMNRICTLLSLWSLKLVYRKNLNHKMIFKQYYILRYSFVYETAATTKLSVCPGTNVGGLCTSIILSACIEVKTIHLGKDFYHQSDQRLWSVQSV